jgi:N-methylhydantoinase A
MSGSDFGMSTPVVAVDTGGTFTDLLLLRGGVLTAFKLLSTPEDPAAAVLEGLRRILEGDAGGECRVILGSTVATNTLLERSGARVSLVTNRGFEDVIEIGRQNRPQLYALVGHRAPPLVARDDRIGIAGRLDVEGAEISPLDRAELERLTERVGGTEAVAVVLLHSYANPAHEAAVVEALRECGLPVSVSSLILPEFREFERTSTTVANAYVAPRVTRYLSRLGQDSAGRRLQVMGSSGGTLTLERAIAEPVHSVLSGPAGGVVAALDAAQRSGLSNVVSFDMGGTSTDVSLIPGRLLQTKEGGVGGIPIAIPLLDIHTVGAGGGSIARLDPGGAVRVGPESAGANPGPIAYGRGGTEVTVTDAHVFLGRIPRDLLLAGTTLLHTEAVTAPMEALARQAGVTPIQLAEGVLEVADTAMEGALRVISVERGVDPADYHLVAFGGAAGLHAAELVERLGLAGALIPPNPGLLSAFGMLVAPVVKERSRTLFVSEDEADGERRLVESLNAMETGAREDLSRDGARPEAVVVERSVDARYCGQSFELNVPADGWASRFHDAHEQRYGYRRSTPVEAVTARVRSEARGEAVTSSAAAPTGGEGESAETSTRFTRVVFRGRQWDARLLPRSALPLGETVLGPAIVFEYSATTWCPPGWSVGHDAAGSLRLGRVSQGQR